MKKYDKEYKDNAVRKMMDGQAVKSVAQELGVSEGVLHNWKKQKVASGSGIERDYFLLKKKLCEVEMERDSLKKAALIFGKGG